MRPDHPDYLAVNYLRRHRLSEALPSRATDSAVEIQERESLIILRPRKEVEMPLKAMFFADCSLVTNQIAWAARF